jgi:predicted transcriptional regulator
VLPSRFRAELSALAGCDVVRATETDPHRAVRVVTRRLDEAESAAIATPIYQDEYAMQLPDMSDIRLLLNEAVVKDTTIDAIDGSTEPPDGTRIRVSDVGFALTVTDEVVMLSLPEIGGGYDTQSELIAEHDRALDWGRRLYDHCWERARPIEEFGG